MPRSKDSFTQEEINNMVKLHYDGYLNKDIAEIYGTSKTMIARIFHDVEIPSRHPFLTEERKNDIKEYYEKFLSKIKTCKAMHCNYVTLNKIIKEYNLRELSMSDIKRKYIIDDNYFDVIDTPNKAYALGIYYADGNVSKNKNYFSISLQERDKDILDKLNHEFGGDRKLSLVEYNKKNDKWQNQYVLSMSSQKMHDDLIKHGCIPNKSLKLKFPTTVPDKLIRHFVRGYFDGDGSIAKNEDRCTLISTQEFCDELKKIVKELLSVNSSIMYCHNKKDKPTRTFQIAGKYQVKKFLDWLYDDADLYLERKRNLYLKKYYSNNINNSL